MVLDPKDICVLMLYDDYYAKLAEVTIDKNVKQHIGKDYNTRNIIILSLRKIGV